MRYVVCYDSPSRKRRTKLAKRMEGFGFRVQYSVFECELTPPLLAELIRLFDTLIDPDADNIRVYPVCEGCSRKIHVAGVSDPCGLRSDAFFF